MTSQILLDARVFVPQITLGGYLEYRGGKIFCYLSTPTVLNTLLGTHDIPRMYHDIPHGTQITKDDIPHGTHAIPHVHHDILPRY